MFERIRSESSLKSWGWITEVIRGVGMSILMKTNRYRKDNNQLNYFDHVDTTEVHDTQFVQVNKEEGVLFVVDQLIEDQLS